MKRLTLGSLFSGIGGFELGGLLAGIEPRWLSEIDPFAVLVTHKRLPGVKYYGDVCKLKGTELEPVDVVTAGFPCQSVSISGRREGLKHIEHGGEKTTRSGLFYEAVRIIKEMREATNGKYPRYAVAENVPGLFSSQGGEDFRTVLEELARVKGGEVHVPKPEGKWTKAGEIVGDDFSIAWRVLDSQYWGTAQRRARVYIIADFGGESAGKILFESEGMWRNTSEGIGQGQGITGSIEECTGATGGIALENHPADSRLKISEDGKVQTLTERMGTGGGNTPLVLAYGICSKQSHAMLSDNPKAGFYEAQTSRTLDQGGGNPTCNQGGMCILQTYDVRITSDGTKNARAHCYKTEISRCLETSEPNPDSNHGSVCILERRKEEC